MKCIIRNYGLRMSSSERYVAKAEAVNATLVRGTNQKPLPPRDIVAQPGPRGILLTWNLPQGFTSDIQRWRVYKNDELTLYAELNDRGTRQHFIETTAGSTPPVTNLFVSSVNSLGIESQKVQVQGQATVEAGAPAMPTTPPGYSQGGAGGGNTSSNYNSEGNRLLPNVD